VGSNFFLELVILVIFNTESPIYLGTQLVASYHVTDLHLFKPCHMHIVSLAVWLVHNRVA